MMIYKSYVLFIAKRVSISFQNMFIRIRFSYQPCPLFMPTVAYARMEPFTDAMKTKDGGMASIRAKVSDLFPSLPDDVTFSWVDAKGSSVAMRTDEDLTNAYLMAGAGGIFKIYIHQPPSEWSAARIFAAIAMPVLFVLGLMGAYYNTPRLVCGLMCTYCVIFSLFCWTEKKETPPTYKYQAQLDAMKSIGFDLNVACIALDKANGDLDNAIAIAAKIARSGKVE